MSRAVCTPGYVGLLESFSVSFTDEDGAAEAVDMADSEGREADRAGRVSNRVTV